ncbi:isochorismatase family protein [Pseudomonas putida]
MHPTIIHPDIRARYRAIKGGHEFAHRRVDASRVAHLVIDMQNGFVEEGALLQVPAAKQIVNNINSVSRSVRAMAGVNVFLRFTTTSTSAWPAYFQAFQGEAFASAQVEVFQAGSHGHALIPELQVEPSDLVLNKTRFSAFTHDHSETLRVLRERNIDTVLISGTLTDCCCGATARDAQQLGFRVIMVADANAALSDAEHNASMNSLAAWCADIRTTDQVVELLQGRQESTGSD